MAIEVHPSAFVDPAAQIEDGVSIGPLSIIGPDVKIGKNVRILSQVSLSGNVTIGADCVLYPFVSMGHPPQDFKHKGGPVRIIIGERNIFRETVNVHPGTDAGRRDTVIGNDCYFMVGSHIAHEAILGDHVILSNSVQIGGAVTIGDYAILGGLSAVHQFTRIGAHAFIGGLAPVVADVIPYGSVVGNPSHLAGLNIIGLKRRDFGRQAIRDLRAAYRLLFAQEGTFAERLDDTARLYADSPRVMDIVNFIRNQDKRAVCMPRNGNG